MANAATVGQVCGEAVAIERSTPASHRSLEPGAVFTIWRPAGVIKRSGEEVGTGIYTAAEVAPDGSGVTLTIEVLTPVPAKAAA
jgi:hypothetical protein